MDRRILIVDDHPLFRLGVGQLVEGTPGWSVCAEVGTLDEALETIGAERPDLALVDLSLPGRSGLELIRDLRARGDDVPVLVLSMHDEWVYAERALRAGAQGYLMKEEASAKVIEAVRRVLEGEIYLSESMMRRMLESVGGTDPADLRSPVDLLSDREFQVFRKIGEGKGTREIAEALGIKVRTVETYRQRIKEKLNLRRGVELVRYAVQWAESESRL